MNAFSRLCACTLAIIIPANALQAMISRSDADVSQQFNRATAVFEGQVIAANSFVNDKGNIQTRFSVRVNQPYKGAVPGVVSITLPGGVVGNVAEAVGCQPQLKIGDDRLFLLAEGAKGSLQPVAGCASAVTIGSDGFDSMVGEVQLMSLTALPPTKEIFDANADIAFAEMNPLPQALSYSATNLLISLGDILAARFLPPDRGETIPYLVDADYLPAGISTSEALGAISNAVAAWEASSSVQFSYQGLQSFGQAASSTNLPSDGTLRIQLHDFYGAISGSTTLGIGGRSHLVNPTSTGWTTGGQVFGNDFRGTTRGYVVLKHTKTAMQNLATFEEVVCHEIGHALSMAHSSENPSEPTSTATYQAIMYYQAHADGRGAAPTSYDSNVLNQVHPIANTPPYSFDRIIDSITATPTPSLPGVNEVIAAHDLQGLPVTVAIAESTSINGSFSVVSNLVMYTPPGSGSAARIEPPTLTAYDWTYVRGSDGVHWSPYTTVQVLSFSQDTYPAGASDGIPNQWMIDNFGNANPTVGTDHGANDDKDKDTLSNIDEYRSWMNPNLDTSAQLISAAPDGTVSWQGKAYELYELHGSTNLTDWFFVKAVLPTNDTPTVKVNPTTHASAVYRAFKVK